MDNFDKIFFIIGSISIPFLFSQIVRGKFMVARIKRGYTPDFLQRFPLSKSNYLSLKEAKEAINNFINDLLENRDSKLVLTESEINSFVSSGIQLNVREPGKYIYYRLANKKIYRYTLDWPVYNIFDLYSFKIEEITFRYFENSLYQEIDLIEFNSRKIHTNSKPAYILPSSPFLNLIFNMVYADLHDDQSVSNTIKSQKNLCLIEKIKKINVSNERLILLTDN